LGIAIKFIVAVFNFISEEAILKAVFRNFPFELYSSAVSFPVLFFKPKTETERFEFWENPKLKIDNKIAMKDFDIVVDLNWGKHFLIFLVWQKIFLFNGGCRNSFVIQILIPQPS
jgi:hypothetical protein